MKDKNLTQINQDIINEFDKLIKNEPLIEKTLNFNIHQVEIIYKEKEKKTNSDCFIKIKFKNKEHFKKTHDLVNQIEVKKNQKTQKEEESKNQTLLEICSKNQKNNTLLVDQLKTDFNNQILALQNKIESDIRTSENKNKEQTSTQKISLEGSLNSSIHKSKWLVKDTVFTVLIIGLSGGLGFLGVMLFSTNKKLKKN